MGVEESIWFSVMCIYIAEERCGKWMSLARSYILLRQMELAVLSGCMRRIPVSV